jgi:hypothetical protein
MDKRVGQLWRSECLQSREDKNERGSPHVRTHNVPSAVCSFMLSLVELYDLLEETKGWLRPAKDEYCDESAEHVLGRRCRSNDTVEEITMRDTRLLVLLLAETESGDFILPMAWARFLARRTLGRLMAHCQCVWAMVSLIPTTRSSCDGWR